MNLATDTQQDLLSRTLLVTSSAIEDSVIEVVNLIEETDSEAFRNVMNAMLPAAVDALHTELCLSQAEYESFQQEHHALITEYAKKRASKSRKSGDMFWQSGPNGDALRSAIQAADGQS